jgi:tRNA (adenine57-N1/adenine58-N1)-methyltransferase
VQVPEKGRFSTHRGNVEFARVTGREYGDEVRTHLGFLFYLLRPSIADLALKVKRSTTVVYPKDTGIVLLRSIIFPGARVIECGSGSGALTTILAHFVRPEGRVFSYERRPEFSAVARQNVGRYGLLQFCEFFVRDPEQEGFEQSGVDAVLLDVPEPWSLVPAAHRALAGGNVLSAIVPTVEQLRRAVSAMEVQGFARIHVKEMFERDILMRSSGTRPADRMVAHTVYVALGHKVNRAGLAAVEIEEEGEV